MTLEGFGLAEDRGKSRIMGGVLHAGDVRLLDAERTGEGFLGEPAPAPHDAELRGNGKLGELLRILLGESRIVLERLLQMGVEAALGHFSHDTILLIRLRAKSRSCLGVLALFFSMLWSSQQSSSTQKNIRYWIP